MSSHDADSVSISHWNLARFSAYAHPPAVLAGITLAKTNIAREPTVGPFFLSTLSFTPGLAAIIVYQQLYAESWRELTEELGLRLPKKKALFKTLLSSYFLPIILAVCSVGASSLLVSDVSLDVHYENVGKVFSTVIPRSDGPSLRESIRDLPIHPYFIALLVAVTKGARMNIFKAVGQEIGWRGFSYLETRHMGFWHSSLITGMIWGAWEVPFVLCGSSPSYRDTHTTSELARAAALKFFICMSLSPFLTHIRDASQSVLPTAIFHGVFEGLCAMPNVILSGDGVDDTITGPAGAVGLFVNVCACGALYAWRYFRKDSLTLS